MKNKKLNKNNLCSRHSMLSVKCIFTLTKYPIINLFTLSFLAFSVLP